MFRFIDDLVAINDNYEFEKCYKEIYPSELELKKENKNNSTATFLDLDISIKEGKFETKLFDKRDGFKFSIVRLPFKHSNIPSKMFYSSITAEILRICRATSTYFDFLKTTQNFLKRMKNQGAQEDSLKKVLYKLIFRHSEDFIKFDLRQEDIANDIVS